MSTSPLSYGEVVMAVGALGTAAFGIVDASKGLWGGISRVGLGFLTCLIDKVAPTKDDGTVPRGSALTNEEIDATVRANWLNGMVLSDQKSVVKALVKLRLNPASAPSLAELTGVDPTVLSSVAGKLSSGEALSQAEMDAYGRFDLLLSTSIDRAYQQADQKYRNYAKIAAGAVAVVLALVATKSVNANYSGTYHVTYLQAVIVGLFATPLAPVAKDLSTALTTAVKAVKSVKG